MDREQSSRRPTGPRAPSARMRSHRSSGRSLLGLEVDGMSLCGNSSLPVPEQGGGCDDSSLAELEVGGECDGSSLAVLEEGGGPDGSPLLILQAGGGTW